MTEHLFSPASKTGLRPLGDRPGDVRPVVSRSRSPSEYSGGGTLGSRSPGAQGAESTWGIQPER